MFCKHCGIVRDPNTNFCTKCGCPADQGENFCPNCGLAHGPQMFVCPGCGCPLGYIPPQTTPKKSKIAAGLLAILLGAFGVHNFYLGYTGKGIAQLLLSLLTCGIGAAISSIWGLIEGILILVGNIDKDANGNPLGD